MLKSPQEKTMNPTIATWMLFLHVLAALWLAAGVFAGSVVRAHAKAFRDAICGFRRKALGSGRAQNDSSGHLPWF